MAGILQQTAQAVEHEVEQRVTHWLRQHAGSKTGLRVGNQFGEIERQRRLHEDAQNAECSATQTEGVLVAGRNLADAKETGQRIELVGQRRSTADVAGRQRVAGKTRLVMALHGIGDSLILTVMQRVVTPHDALQLGELPNHVGHQIGLGQTRRARRQRCVGAEADGNFLCQLLKPFDALQHRTDLVVIDNATKLLDTRSECRLAVLIEEETRIGQPRPHDARVTGNDVDRIVHLHVRNDEEFVEQLARRIEQREIFLVLLHGQDQAFLRHFEIFSLELANIDHRPFNQRSDFVEQAIGRIDRGVQFLCFGIELQANGFAALRKAGNGLTLRPERFDVAFGVGDRDLTGRHEAVAARDITAGQPEQFARHQTITVQHDEPMYRTNELVIGITPAHQFGDRQLFQCVGDDAGEHLVKLGALDRSLIEKRLGLAIHAFFKAGDLGDGNALGFEFLEQSWCRLTFGIERDGDRHDLFKSRGIRRHGEHARHLDGQSARCGEPLVIVAGSDQIAIRETGVDLRGKYLAQARQRLGRQLFGEQFNKQCGVHYLPSPLLPLHIGKPSTSREL